MPKRLPPLTEPTTPDEALLERLEHDIITGQQAHRARNDLLVRLANEGVPKSHLARRINRVREMRLVPPLTYSAVERAIGRSS